MGQAVTRAVEARQREPECEAFVSVVFVAVGVLLPLALLLLTEPAESLAAWERRCSGGSSGDSCGSGSNWAQMAAACGTAARGAEAALRSLCGRSWLAPAQPAASAPEGATQAQVLARRPSLRPYTPPLRGWQRGVAWWLLLSLVWAAALEFHSRRQAQGA